MIRFRKNTIYEVLTPNGFKPFSGMRMTTKSEVSSILLSNGKYLETSGDHRFIINGQEVFSKDLITGQEINETTYVVKVDLIKKDCLLYDLTDVGEDSQYMTDGIISHNCDFLASGDTAFETDDLEYYEKNIIQPINKRGQEGNLWIFEEPDYSRDYMVVADVARGDGKDYSACHVIDIESMKQVAEYKAHIQTPDYANFLYALATEYNDAMLVVENSSIGWDVITRLLERGYKNFYYSPKSDILTQEEWVARYNNPNNFTPGFVNSLKSRPLVIQKFREYVSKRQVIINSPRLVSEMRTFIWKNGRAEAQSGYNDDLVMSMAIGLYLRDTAVRFRKANLDLTKNALDNFSVNRGYTDQNAQQTDGSFGIYSGASMNENSVLQQYKDNSWLF